MKYFFYFICIVIFSGCGTTTTKNLNLDREYTGTTYGKVRYEQMKYKGYNGPFSGVIFSTQAAVTAPYDAFKEKSWVPVADLLFFLDVPFSLVMDTLVIPMDLYDMSKIEANKHKKK